MSHNERVWASDRIEFIAVGCPPCSLDVLARAVLVKNHDSRYSPHRCSMALEQLGMLRLCAPGLSPSYCEDRGSADCQGERVTLQPSLSVSQGLMDMDGDNGHQAKN